MGEYKCYLITILYGDEILECALKTKYGEEFPLEKDARQILWEQLPLHVRNIGKIVHVKPLFEVCINE